MGPNSAVTALPSRGSLSNICDRLPQHDAKFAKLDDKYIQCKEPATSPEACLENMKSQLTAFRSYCNVLRAANDNLLKSQGTDQEELSSLRARALELKTEL